MSENLEEKKPIYKKWWIWVIVAIVILGIGSNSIQNNTQQATSNNLSLIHISEPTRP